MTTPIRTGIELKEALTAILNKMVKPQADKIMRKVGLDAYTSLVRHSPVDMGFLRSNWILAVNIQPPDGELEPEQGKSYPEPTKPNMSLVHFDSYLSFFNNTAYAQYVEDGTEKMAAQPMVAPTEILVQKTMNDLVDVLNQQVIQ